MKTIKTTGRIMKIEDHDVNLIPIFLQDVLQEHRSSLIAKLLNGLDTYIRYKFNVSAAKNQINKIKDRLIQLQQSGLNIDNYQFILEQTLKNDSVTLDNGLFYIEIDRTIEVELKHENMSEKKFEPWETPIFNNKDFREFIRKQMVDELQTEKGLLKYLKEHYGVQVKEKEKINYILTEVREHFKGEPTDPKWIHELFKRYNLTDFHSGNKYIMDKELLPILNKHFEHAV